MSWVGGCKARANQTRKHLDDKIKGEKVKHTRSSFLYSILMLYLLLNCSHFLLSVPFEMLPAWLFPFSDLLLSLSIVHLCSFWAGEEKRIRPLIEEDCPNKAWPLYQNRFGKKCSFLASADRACVKCNIFFCSCAALIMTMVKVLDE